MSASVIAARAPSLLGLGIGRDDVDDAAAAAAGELDHAGRAGEERVVTPDPHALAGAEARSPLADDDLAAVDRLAREHLDAEALALGVAAVAARAEPLLMSHPTRPPRSSSSRRPPDGARAA